MKMTEDGNHAVGLGEEAPPENTIEVRVTRAFDARAFLNEAKARQDMKRQARWLSKRVGRQT